LFVSLRYALLVCACVAFFFLMRRPPPRSPLFPYTTLFRSSVAAHTTRPARPVRSSDADGKVQRTATRPSTASRAVGSTYARRTRSEEHTSELQSLTNLVCRLLLEKKNNRHTEREQWTIERT